MTSSILATGCIRESSQASVISSPGNRRLANLRLSPEKGSPDLQPTNKDVTPTSIYRSKECESQLQKQWLPALRADPEAQPAQSQSCSDENGFGGSGNTYCAEEEDTEPEVPSTQSSL